jgi:hypothetical protein
MGPNGYAVTHSPPVKGEGVETRRFQAANGFIGPFEGLSQ